MCLIGRTHHCIMQQHITASMTHISYLVLVCTLSILFNPASSRAAAEGNNLDYLSNDNVIKEPDCNKKLVANIFHSFANIPNGFDPFKDPKLQIDKTNHKKPSVICWTHIVTTMKNNEDETIDEISEYAISFESPKHPGYDYVINSDPDVFGNTRTFFVSPPEIIYRKKDHIAEKKKYITCSFSSQYHKSYSELGDGNVEIQIVKDNKKSETGKLVENNCSDKEIVTEQIRTQQPAGIFDLIMEPNRERHEVVKKDNPVVEEGSTTEKQFTDYYDTTDETTKSGMFSWDVPNNNDEKPKGNCEEYWLQPFDLYAKSMSRETTEANTYIPTTNEDMELSLLRREANDSLDDSNEDYNKRVPCYVFNENITVIKCPLDVTALPRIDESLFPDRGVIKYLDKTPDITEKNQRIYVGQQQCYLLEILKIIKCPGDRSKMVLIKETTKKEIPNAPDRKMIAEQNTVPQSVEDEDYSSAEQSIEITEKHYNVRMPEETTMYPEMYTTMNSPVALPNEIHATGEASVDSFVVKTIKFNIFEDENNIMEKCLEVDGHISVANCPSETLLLPTINETTLPRSVSFHQLQDIPDLGDSKLLVRGNMFCYILTKTNEIPCPSDESELVTILDMDIKEPISGTTQEPLEWQSESLAENNVLEMATVPAPEYFTVRFAKVKIDNSGENNSLKLTCNYIDKNIFELNCPSDNSDIPYFDENLLPEYVVVYHMDKLPTLTDNMLLFRGNKKCYLLIVLTIETCPTDTTNLLTLPILEAAESKSPSTTQETKTHVPDESGDETEEDCDYDSSEEGTTDKTLSTKTISKESRHFLVRFIDIISFDEIAVTCYNVDKYISLLSCPENRDEIPEFDVQKLPKDTIISDKMSEPMRLSENQMLVKGKGRCYALTKFNMAKCPLDGQRRILNVIDCKIDSESLESFDTEPISNLENVLNPGFPIVLETTHISQRPDIPTYTTVTCENVKNNIGIVNCPATGFSKISITDETLLSEYPKYMHTNMSELNDDSVLMAQGKIVCYIFEKNGEIDCPKDLKNVVRLVTHDVIQNAEDRSSSTEYVQNIETTTEVTSASSETTEETDENNTFPVALQVLHISPQSNMPSFLTTTCKSINRTILIVNCHTGFQQIPIINDKLLSKYANQIISKNISEFSNSMLLVRGNKYCYVLDQVGQIECPDDMNEIMKVLIKRVVESEERMTTFTTSRPPEDKIKTFRDYLEDIKNAAEELFATTPEIISTTSNPTEEMPRTSTEYRQDVDSGTYTLNEATVEITSTTSSPTEDRIKTFRDYLEDIKTAAEELFETTPEIISTTGEPNKETVPPEDENNTFPVALQVLTISPDPNIQSYLTITCENIDSSVSIIRCPDGFEHIPVIKDELLAKYAKQLIHKHIVEFSDNMLLVRSEKSCYIFDKVGQVDCPEDLNGIIKIFTKQVIRPEEYPGSTEHLQDIETSTTKLHETTAEITSTISSPTQDRIKTFRDYLEDIKTAAEESFETTPEIISTTSKPTEEKVRTSTETSTTFNEIPMEVTSTTSGTIEETDADYTFPVALQVLSISPDPNIPSNLTITCENINSSVSIIRCPDGFEHIPVIKDELLAKYAKQIILKHITEFSDNMLLVRSEKSCYIFDKVGQVDCPEDLNGIIKIFTKRVIRPEESSGATEHLQDIETSTTKFNEIPMEVTSTTSGTIEETDADYTFPVALQVLSISPDPNIPSNLTITCENINSNVSIIRCPNGFEHLPVIKEQLLAKYAKQIILKHIVEFSDNMLLVRSVKSCYIFDKLGQVDCPEDLNGIIKIFTKRVIRPEESPGSTEHLQDIETSTTKLHETTAEISFTTSKPTEDKIRTFREYLQGIKTVANELLETTPEIISTTSKPKEEMPSTSTEYRQDVDSGTYTLNEATAEITSTTSRPTEDKIKMFREYLEDIKTGTNQLHETTTEMISTSSESNKETVPPEDENNTFPVALQVLSISPDPNIPSYLTITCENIDSSVSIIRCPDGFEHIPVIKDELLSKYAKQIKHKNILEFSDNMLVVRSVKNCYIFDKVGQIHCPEDLNGIIKIFTKRVLRPEESPASTEHLQDIETSTRTLHETTAEITSTTSKPTEDNITTSTEYLQDNETVAIELYRMKKLRTSTEYRQDIETSTRKLHETTAEITSTTSKPTEDKITTSTEYLQDNETVATELYKMKMPGTSTEYRQDVDSGTYTLHEATAEITSTTSRPTEQKVRTSTEYLQDIETGTKELHETTAEIIATTSKPKEMLRTSTVLRQDVDSGTYTLHEATAEIISTTSRPTEEKVRTSTEFLQDIETGTKKMHETTAEIATTTSTPVEWKPKTSTEYLQDIETGTYKLHETTAEIASTTSSATEEKVRTSTEYLQNIKTGTHTLHETTAEIKSSTTSIPTEENPITSTVYLQDIKTDTHKFHETTAELISTTSTPTEKKSDTVTEYQKDIETSTYKLHETTAEIMSISSGTTKGTEPVDDNNNFPVALQVLHESPQRDVPSYVTGTCIMINGTIAHIDCPTGIEHIPRIKDKRLSTYAKEIVYKNISEFRDNMLVVRGDKDCYVLDRIGPTDLCWERQDDVMHISTKQVIKAKEPSTTRNHLKKIETGTNQLPKSTAELTSTASRLIQEKPTISTEQIGTGANELHESAAEIISKEQITSTIADTGRSQNISTSSHSYSSEAVTTEKTEHGVHDGVSTETNRPVTDHHVPEYLFQNNIRGNRRSDFMPLEQKISAEKNDKTSRFPVKIFNIFSPNNTLIVCKYVDKNIKLINTSTEVHNLPFIEDAHLPKDVQFEYMWELPHITGNKRLLVRGMTYYYLLQEYDTLPCPENTADFVPITMYYGTQPTTPLSQIMKVEKDYDAHNVTVPKGVNNSETVVRKAASTMRRINRHKAQTTVHEYPMVGKYSIIMTFIGKDYNETICAYVDEYMTRVDGRRQPKKLRIDQLPKTRFYYSNRAPVEMTANRLGMRAKGVWYIYNGYEEYECPDDTTFYMRRSVYYPRYEVQYFPAKVVNIPKPYVIETTCKMMEITELDWPLVLGNLPFIDIPLLPDNVIIKYKKYDPSMVDDKNILVQYVSTYYILTEHKQFKCPKNMDKFLPVVIIADFFKPEDDLYVKRDIYKPDHDLNMKRERSSGFTDTSEENARTILDSPEMSEIFEPGYDYDELSVIPLEQEKKRKAALPVTPHASVAGVVSKSTEGPPLPSPAFLNSVVVKYNNAENEEECYEVNNHMHVNKIPCPADTSRIPKVINPEFIKLLCPKKLRPKFKYMTGLGILRKLNMIIH